MTDHFTRMLDWVTQGKYVRVYASNAVYEGYLACVRNQQAVILHNATEVNRDREVDVGSVFLRVCNTIEVIEPQKNVTFVSLDELDTFPGYDVDVEADPDIVRRCYRNKSAGSFPVVTTDGMLINGHKRVKAAKLAGLDRHAVEVVDVTPKQARELFEIAHPNLDLEGDTDDETDTPRQNGAGDGARLNTPTEGYHQ